MSAPDKKFVLISKSPDTRFSLEPVRNILNSLLLLNKVDDLSGLDPWLAQLAQNLPTEELIRNQIVCDGLYYAIQPIRNYQNFDEYLEGVATENPVYLRNRVFSVYEKWAAKCDTLTTIPSRAELLADENLFIDYLKQIFPHIDEKTERAAHQLMTDPPQMQRLIVEHLRNMWENYFSAEWTRITPMLRQSVDAFKREKYTEKNPIQIAKELLGDNVEDISWEEYLADAREVIFVPSAHVGPYVGKFIAGSRYGIFFGARLPDTSREYAPELSRTELLVRLSALADDARLSILQILSERGEVCAQEIMARLELSQSATSRHLRQLSAAGYITERRREAGKCYSLNAPRFKNTFKAAQRFLLNKNPKRPLKL